MDYEALIEIRFVVPEIALSGAEVGYLAAVQPLSRPVGSR